MAHSYIPVDRAQSYLLPPNMADWLPEDHLAWFIIDVVAKVETAKLHERHPNNGVGRRAYDPEMLLALVIYAYCTKVRSSREVERFCRSDIAYRVLCAGHIPDHTTISRFRQDFSDLAKNLFVDVLELASEAGMGSVGVVALDGTKMGADASTKANRSREALEKEVAKMMAEAEQADIAEDVEFGDSRGDELPEDLSKASPRRQRIDSALNAIKARAAKERTPRQQRLSAERIAKAKEREAASKKRLEDRRAQEQQRTQRRREPASQGKPNGPPPKSEAGSTRLAELEQSYKSVKVRREKAEQENTRDTKAANTGNLTDPDSRIMKTQKGWIQGYNAQSAVNEHGIIVGCDVCDDPTDQTQFVPMVANIDGTLKAACIQDAIGTLVADAGYLSEDNLNADGPNRLIATGKSHKMKKQPLNDAPVPDSATAVERNEHLLRTTDGRATYAKRQHMIEPVFGHTKGNRGYRGFVRRGLEAVTAEWNFMMMAHNVQKLYAGSK